MSLFGAATSGVDPRTGSYLNKEQRIAMFRASQGRGGAGGGARQDRKGGVDPQSQIVVVNKMSSIVKTLQTTFQESAETINQQVEQNKKDIENLYNLISANREQELKQEKLETKDARKDKESLLRGAREKLVEGLSSALSTAYRGISSIVKKAATPGIGLIQRLLKALGLLAGAWAVDNLDLILDKLSDWKDVVQDLPTVLKEKALDARGVWSVLDNIFGGVKNAVGRLAAATFKLGKWVATQVSKVVRKIFEKLASFTQRVVGSVLGKLRSFLSAQLRKLSSVKKPKAGSPDVDTPKGTKPPSNTPDSKPAKPKNWFQKLGDKTQEKIKGFTKKFFEGNAVEAQEALKNPAKAAAMAEEGKNVKPSSKISIQKIFQPLSKLGPTGKGIAGTLTNIMQGSLGKFLRLTRGLPGLGIAIDSILNMMAGQSPLEAIIRGVPSGIGGSAGWTAGAFLGGKLGLAAGSIVPGIGNAIGLGIGALLGGLVGSIIGGATGDKLGAAGYEMVTGQEAMTNQPLGGELIDGLVDMVRPPAGTDTANALKQQRQAQQSPISINGDAHMEQDESAFQFKVSGNYLLSDKAASGSTPDGMRLSSQPRMQPIIQTLDLPDKVYDQRSGDMPMETSNNTGQEIPFFPSFNPEMDIYRGFSMSEYQLIPSN